MKRITLFALMLIFCLGGMAQQKKGTVKKDNRREGCSHQLYGSWRVRAF